MATPCAAGGVPCPSAGVCIRSAGDDTDDVDDDDNDDENQVNIAVHCRVVLCGALHGAYIADVQWTGLQVWMRMVDACLGILQTLFAVQRRACVYQIVWFLGVARSP